METHAIQRFYRTFKNIAVMETSNIERNKSIHLFGKLTRPLGKTSHVSLLTETLTFQIILLFILTHKPQYCWIQNSWDNCCFHSTTCCHCFSVNVGILANSCSREISKLLSSTDQNNLEVKDTSNPILELMEMRYK